MRQVTEYKRQRMRVAVLYKLGNVSTERKKVLPEEGSVSLACIAVAKPTYLWLKH